MFTSFFFCFKMTLVICAFNSVFRTELKHMLSSLGIHSGVWKAVWFLLLLLLLLLTHLKRKTKVEVTRLSSLTWWLSTCCLYLISHLSEALPQVVSHGGLPSVMLLVWKVNFNTFSASFISQYIFWELLVKFIWW